MSSPTGGTLCVTVFLLSVVFGLSAASPEDDGRDGQHQDEDAGSHSDDDRNVSFRNPEAAYDPPFVQRRRHGRNVLLFSKKKKEKKMTKQNGNISIKIPQFFKCRKILDGMMTEHAGIPVKFPASTKKKMWKNEMVAIYRNEPNRLKSA